MAVNLQKHLNAKEFAPLKYWNRTISRGDVLKEQGGVPCDSIGELVQSCDVIFISVRTPFCHHETRALFNMRSRSATTLYSSP